MARLRSRSLLILAGSAVLGGIACSVPRSDLPVFFQTSAAQNPRNLDAEVPSTNVPAPGAKARAAGAIEIAAGESIQSAVDHNPPGTSFAILAGVHRRQQVIPKEGDTFIGEPGAILNGAMPLTEFEHSGALWIASAQIQQNTPHGECVASAAGCQFAEDLFMDDVPLTHVTSLNRVDTNSYFFDYGNGKIYLGRDPAGHKVEVAATPTAFSGSASDVTIRGLAIEKYANRAQVGAIEARVGRHWIIEGNLVYRNHGVGILGGATSVIRGNRTLLNGQLGLAAIGAGILVEDNEVAFNNTRGFNHYWEAGGTKFVLTEDLMVRGNHVHHNHGPGLWTDIDNIRTTYEGNLVYQNDYVGIFHEISFDAIIRNNIVALNGKDQDTWLWGAQILLSTSQNVEVSGNTVYVHKDFGNGIGVIQQKRETGSLGVYRARNNLIRDNSVTYEGAAGRSGAVADYDETGMLGGNNRFEHNSYHIPAGTKNGRWTWNGEMTFTEMTRAGKEAGGVVDQEIQPFVAARQTEWK